MTVKIGFVAIVLLVGGCGSHRGQTTFSYETKMRRAAIALRDDRLFEARKWVSEALKMKPQQPEAQLLMAHVIDREIEKEKTSPESEIPEELTPEKKSLQIKTWLERSRGFLEINQLKEAQWAAEQVFQLDPQNLDASRLMDEIKMKAQKQGRDDELFLQELYQEEISTRIQSYIQQAETRIQDKQWAAARFAVEKILILDPKNVEGRRLLSVLDKREKTV